MEREITIIKEVNNEEDLMLLSEINNEKSINLEKEGTGGTSDYQMLANKPQINGVELNGNKTSEELGIPQQLIAGDNIEIVDNVISVLTAPNVEKDNTKPITSSAVYTEVGNINILLQTI